MAYFNVCENCGAHLDPGERCTCQKEKKHLPYQHEKSRYINKPVERRRKK